VSGSHSLEKFINGVGRDVIDPETKLSVNRRVQLQRIRNGRGDERKEARDREDLRISALGSGSDYSSFLDHMGIPSMNLGFGGEDDGGIYHSIYDDFYWFTHYSDSTFVYGKALSQAAGTAVMRLASADILPFAFSNLAETSGKYLKELKKLRDSVADQITERNSEIGENVYFATSDPRDPTVAPARQDVAPQLKFDPLDKASDSLTKSAARYDAAYTKALEGMSGANASRDAKINSINERLLQAERALTSSEGLPGRPWYRHLIYAPGFYTGYGVKTMPGPREAIEQHEWGNVDHEIDRVATALNNEATLVSELARELEALR
jgi:N-acetylated-alpha-linked acidic dipeptidase